MPSSLIFFIPASWIILVPLIFFISEVVFFASLKIFMVKESGEIFKKYFLKIFLAVFFSNIICSILIFLVGILPFGYFIYDKSIIGILFKLICICTSIVLNIFLLYKIMFLNLKIDDRIKKYVSILISILSAPYILLFL